MMRGKRSPRVPTRLFEGLPEEHIEHYERELDAPDEAIAFGKALLDQLRGS